MTKILIPLFLKNMLKKVIAFNGSPRKGWNTDQLVKKCLEGAKSAGAEVKLYEVSDLKNIKPCISCLYCKRVEPKFRGVCVVKDGLTPILKELKTADAIVIGAPIYFGNISAAIHPILERMCFSNYSYRKTNPSNFGRKIKTAFILPMNASYEYAKTGYAPLFKQLEFQMKGIFGSCEIMPVYNTLQVEDYSQYEMSLFNPEDKKREHREVFPKKLEEAFELGKRLVL